MALIARQGEGGGPQRRDVPRRRRLGRGRAGTAKRRRRARRRLLHQPLRARRAVGRARRFVEASTHRVPPRRRRASPPGLRRGQAPRRRHRRARRTITRDAIPPRSRTPRASRARREPSPSTPTTTPTKPVIVVQIKGKKFTYFSSSTYVARESATAPTSGERVRLRDAACVLEDRQRAGTGLAQGAMIALVALGYTMVYGILKLINFAHSEVFMMGAYAGLFVITALGGAEGPARPVAGIGWPPSSPWSSPALLGVTSSASPTARSERAAASRPTRAHHPAGHRARHERAPAEPGAAPLHRAVSRLPAPAAAADTRLVIFVSRSSVMVAPPAPRAATWSGKAMRALSMNMEAARLMGVRTWRIIALTFALGLDARGGGRGALLPRPVAGVPDDGRHHRHARLRRRGHRRHREHPGRDARRRAHRRHRRS